MYVSSSGEARYFATVDLEEPGPDVEEPDPNLPPEIDEPTVEEPTIEPDPEPSHLEINQITAPSEALAEVIATTTAGTTIETTTEPTVESTKKGNETSSVDIPLTSNVVTNTAKKCAKSEFPWWFIVLVLAGDAIIVWFFMPKPRKTR